MAVLSQGHSFVWGRALKNTMGSTGWHLALPAMLPKEKGRQFCTCGFFPFLFQSWQFSLSSRVPYYAPEIAICFYFSARNQLWRCSCRKVNEEFQPKNENKGVKRVVIISNIFTFFLNFFYIYLSQLLSLWTVLFLLSTSTIVERTNWKFYNKMLSWSKAPELIKSIHSHVLWIMHLFLLYSKGSLQLSEAFPVKMLILKEIQWAAWRSL